MTSLKTIVAKNDILIVEDDSDTLLALERTLEAEGYVVRTAMSGMSALSSVTNNAPSIVLLDLGLPDTNGVELLGAMLSKGVQHVIVISGTNCAGKTRQCLRQGAFDFLLKPANHEDLLRAVRRATSSYQINQVTIQEYPSKLTPGFGSLETPSKISQRMFRLLKQIATQRPSNALIVGATGLFKRDIAALLHHYTRSTGPALLINCALERDDNAAARFQGTNGSTKIHTGHIKRAEGGSLVLDDLSRLSQSAQALLSEHIEQANKASENSRHLSRSKACNIVGILKEPIAVALESGRLQSGLHAALSANIVEVPTLKQRPEDVIFFARQAVSQLNALLNSEKTLSQDFENFLTAQAWKGNLIELKNRLLTAYRGTENGEEIVFDSMLWPLAANERAAGATQSPGVGSIVGMTLNDAETRLIEATLASVDDNKSKAAKILGISVKTLYNRSKA